MTTAFTNQTESKSYCNPQEFRLGKCFSEKRGAVNFVNFQGEFHEASTTRVPNLTKRQTWVPSASGAGGGGG